MSQTRATELIDVSEAEFHRDETTGKMTGKITIIKAGRAINPRNYRSSAIQKAAKEGIYDGMRMYVDHSDKPPTKRSMRDMVAAVESTEYDAKEDRVVGNVEFFDPKFFDFANRARKYIGVSAAHRIQINRVRESSGQVIEDVLAIPQAHSVDWVIYPSAGGEALSFARESEGADDVEWGDITLEQLKANAPELLTALKGELAKESKGPDDEPDDDGGDEGDSIKVTKKQLASMVKEAVQEAVEATTNAANETAKKRDAAGKAIREYVGKAGLPQRTAARVIAGFSNVLEFVENDVKEAIDDAKEELRAAGLGPRIAGEGPSKVGVGAGTQTVSVHESIKTGVFGIKPKKTDKKED